MYSINKCAVLRGWFVLAIGVCGSCGAPDMPQDREAGHIRIVFDPIVGDKDLVLRDVRYENQRGEDFAVTKFNYFVSNFKLRHTDGSVYIVPQDSCYFLVKADDRASQFVTLKGIPFGEYDQVEFMVGVDSLRNTMHESRRTGALDPGGDMAGDGMYWAWNSGYIFMKLEGTSSYGNPVNDKFYYHIGLYGGYKDPTVNNTRIVTLGFGNEVARVSEENIPDVQLLADVLTFFDGPATRLSIADYPAVMAATEHRPLTQKLADNYRQMFTYDHVR